MTLDARQAADRERWNSIYRAGSHESKQPDASLVRVYGLHIAPAFRDRESRHALDLAGGTGRNALWLAARGWRTTLNDLSDEAVDAACREAEATGLPLTARRESAAETLAWARAHGVRYQLVLLLYYLERPLFPLLDQALAPDGMLFIKTRTEDHRRFTSGSHHPEYFLKPGELLRNFQELQVIESSEAGGMAELLVRR